ncbi:hypothetical protein ElyMa_000157000 [Elysia marginata]|uniref:Uncharacterized protein n=1 Tax=Elysia marginata TaxID=1093978 RepID=A0AAV4ESJ1_9GAST|nr:hypothetical protein ElyMa_000157000 [Elysia marginata]
MPMEWHVIPRLCSGAADSWIAGPDGQGNSAYLKIDLCARDPRWCHCHDFHNGRRLDANYHDLDGHYGLSLSVFHRGHLGFWALDAEECKCGTVCLTRMSFGVLPVY